ncbi:flagellar basal-body MS-ring/collar protein FliF [Peristeroidobacter soli]|uniref:flagellar basal-body MS-ring/collar protein FliF n=1 Tax=Peristeroidobacter soli TaxID=2497877 RepID=UPI001C37DAC5|nr:flagellar basal-body MS-ring/collar protein FliF [Peristeroidobacter soli]
MARFWPRSGAASVPNGNASAPPPFEWAGLLRSLAPLVLLATVITAVVLMFAWRDQSSFKPLFGAREKVAAADMMTVLDGAGIPYRIHPDTGQVLVPGNRLGEVRMLLASKGVVAQLPAGLELMDRSDPLGVSQFVQDVRFRRGLEGELSQSIMTIDAVETARVHIAIAKSSSFVVNTAEPSSASVVLGLKAGRKLSNEQIAAIVKMVASSATGLDPANVTLVDQSGNLLSSRVDLAEGFEAQVNDAAAHYRDETLRSAENLLAPVVGNDNFKLSVTADVDNDKVQETHEQYGDTPKVTNESTRAENDTDPLALGVPGSLSNRPIDVGANAQAGQESSKQRNAATRQFAYDRSVTQIQRSKGRLKKLSVAVVLNDAAAPTGGAWSEAQLANIDKILRSGLGIDTTRGDSLVVSSLGFPKPAPPPVWWQQPERMVDIGMYVAYALAALFAYLFIARPMLRMARQRLELPAPTVQQIEATPVPAAAPAGAAIAAAALPTPSANKGPIPVGPLLEDYDLPPPGSPVDVMVDHLRALAAKEPERVAEVVKQWVQKNVRRE